jgi:hypothetical protein
MGKLFTCCLFNTINCLNILKIANKFWLKFTIVFFSNLLARFRFRFCFYDYIYAISKACVSYVIVDDIQLFQLRLSPEQSGKVEYERERLLGFANK